MANRSEGGGEQSQPKDPFPLDKRILNLRQLKTGGRGSKRNRKRGNDVFQFVSSQPGGGECLSICPAKFSASRPTMIDNMK